MTKCLGVNSIPVRVTTPHSRKVALEAALRVSFLFIIDPWSLDGHYFESMVILRFSPAIFYADFFSGSSVLDLSSKRSASAIAVLALA